MKTPHILMMAAGTGGHVFPALAVAEELTQRGAVVHWLGTANGMENGLVEPTGYTFHAIAMQGLRGKGIGRLLKMPVTLLSATMAVIKIIRSNQIDMVVGFGGYVTAPGGIAARITRTPLIIHEQNAIAGMSNRYLAKIATKVLQAFENTFANSQLDRKLETVGNPVRNTITGVAAPSARYDISDQSPLRLLVVGGSLGAQVLNDTVPKALALLDRPFAVRHQCGRNNEATTQAAYDGGNLAAGGSGVAMPLTDIERQVAEVVAPIAKEKGLMFVGLDLIGGRITEINVTSPTCVREIDDQCGTDIATDLIVAIEKHCKG